jgi:hypothetical protein
MVILRGKADGDRVTLRRRVVETYPERAKL